MSIDLKLLTLQKPKLNPRKVELYSLIWQPWSIPVEPFNIAVFQRLHRNSTLEPFNIAVFQRLHRNSHGQSIFCLQGKLRMFLPQNWAFSVGQCSASKTTIHLRLVKALCEWVSSLHGADCWLRPAAPSRTPPDHQTHATTSQRLEQNHSCDTVNLLNY